MQTNENNENTKENQGLVLWLTGLSGAGKTTIANKVAEKLYNQGFKYEIIDGDIIRSQLNLNLGFNDEGRKKNVSIAGYVANLLSKHGVIVLVALISPFREQRNMMKKTINNFVEIYVNAPLEICIQRDEKGLYRKAIAGEIKNFTGISHGYEAPLCPDIELNTDTENVEQSEEKIILFLNNNYFRGIT